MKKLLLLILVMLSACGGLNETPESFRDKQRAESERDKSNDQRRYEMEMVDKLCNSEALVGYEQSFKIAFDGKFNELNDIKASLGVNYYKKLAQELQNYSVEWEMLNQEMKSACKANAIALARYDKFNSGTRQDVKNAEQYYQSKIDKAKDFVLKLTELKIQK